MMEGRIMILKTLTCFFMILPNMILP